MRDEFGCGGGDGVVGEVCRRAGTRTRARTVGEFEFYVWLRGVEVSVM